MRDIIEVIENISKEIPEQQHTFLRELKILIDSILYTAPEALGWKQLSEIISYYIPSRDKIKEDWQTKVVDMLEDKKKNDLKQAMKKERCNNGN